MRRSKTIIDPCTLNLFTSVNYQSITPIHLQLQNLIIFAINSGKLKPGDQLPSRNTLLQILDVQIEAITKAYHELNILGILSSRQGVGIYVTPEAPALCATRCQKILVKNIYEVIQEAKAAGMDEKVVKNIVAECLKMETQPYAGAPAELLKLGKRK